MRIIVFGAGMYVTGKGGTGVGTVLSSLAEASKGQYIEEVVVVARKPSNRRVVGEAQERINRLLGTDLKVRYESLARHKGNASVLLSRENPFDCGIVALPDDLHYPFTRLLLENGIHSLVVKPFTPTISEAVSLVSLQEKKGLYGAVEFHKRYDETNLYIKRVLSGKTLGKLLYISVNYSQRITIPTRVFKEWSAKTNVFQYIGVHYVDLVYFLTGYLPKKVLAVGVKGTLNERKVSEYDAVLSTILWERGSDTFVSHITTNWIDPACSSALSDQKFQVVGTKGRVECDQKNRGLEVVLENTGIQAVNPYFSEYLPENGDNLRFQGYGHRSIATFLEDVRGVKSGVIRVGELEKKRPTFRQSLHSTAVVEAVNKSLSRKSSWVNVHEVF